MLSSSARNRSILLLQSSHRLATSYIRHENEAFHCIPQLHNAFVRNPHRWYVSCMLFFDVISDENNIVFIVHAYTYERLNKTDAVLLVVDHQEGLYQLGRDRTPVEFKNNILAHAALGQVFDLPVVLTSSSDTGALWYCLEHGGAWH